MAAAFVVGAIGVVSSGSESTVGVASAAPSNFRPLVQSPLVPREPRPIDSAEIAKYQSDNARRAGYAAYATGDFATALAEYQAAVDADPNDPEARNNLGQLLVRQNRAEEALPHLDEAVRRDPQKWAYRFNRARALGEVDRLKEAADEYQAAANMFSEDYATFYNLGLTFMKLKQYAQSATALERAVALAPSEPSFLITLGTAYVGAERPDLAKTAFERFLIEAPQDPEAPRVKALIGALDAAAVQ